MLSFIGQCSINRPQSRGTVPAASSSNSASDHDGLQWWCPKHLTSHSRCHFSSASTPISTSPHRLPARLFRLLVSLSPNCQITDDHFEPSSVNGYLNLTANSVALVTQLGNFGVLGLEGLEGRERGSEREMSLAAGDRPDVGGSVRTVGRARQRVLKMAPGGQLTGVEFVPLAD